MYSSLPWCCAASCLATSTEMPKCVSASTTTFSVVLSVVLSVIVGGNAPNWLAASAPSSWVECTQLVGGASGGAKSFVGVGSAAGGAGSSPLFGCLAGPD